MRTSAARGLLTPRFVFVLALAAGSFTVTLGFQLDDFWLIPAAGDQLVGLARMPWDGPPPHPKPDSPTFQPVLYALLAGIALAAPTPIPAWPFHGLALILHAAAAALLCRVISRRSGAAPAFAGAILFAVAPMGMQAWTWISASGAVLAVLFTLLACDHLDRTRGRGIMVAGVCAALGVVCQRGAVVALPFLAVFAALQVPGPRRPAAVLGIAVLPLAMLAVQGYAGGFHYLGGTRAGSGALRHCVEAIPVLVLDLLAPRNPEPLASRGFFDGLPRAALLLPWALLAAASGVASIRRVLAGLGILALASAPALLHWAMLAPSGQTALGARSLYLPAAALCATAAIAVPERGRRRTAAAIALALAVGVAADGFLARARDELAGARDVLALRTGVARLAAGGGAGTLVLVAEPHVTRAGVPLVSAPFVPDAFAPPFVAAPLRVRAHESSASLFADPALRTEPGPLAVFDRSDGTEALLPPLPLVPVTWAPGPAADTWIPAAPLPGRALAAVRVRPEPGSAVTGVMAEAGGIRALAYAHDVGAAETFTLGFLDEPALLLAEEVTRLTTKGALHHPPATLSELPQLPAPLSPADGAEVDVSTVPDFVCDGWPRGAGLRLDLRFAAGDFTFTARYAFAAGELDHPGEDRVAARPTGPRLLDRTKPDFSFESAPRMFRDELRPFGLGAVTMRWRAVATAPGSPTPMAASAWRTARLVLR